VTQVPGPGRPRPAADNPEPVELDVDLPSSPPSNKPWDPEPGREKLRGYLAGGLVVLLAGVIAAAWVTLWLRIAPSSEVKDLLGIMLTPVVALVGSAVGFYFGGKASK